MLGEWKCRSWQGNSVGESQETCLWEANRKETGGQAEVTFLFFPIGFCGRSIWTEPPPCNSVFVWVVVGWCASCSRSSRRGGSILLLQGSGWEAGGTGLCRIMCSWPGNLVIRALPISQKKFSCFVGWTPSASAAAQGAKAPSCYSPASPRCPVFVWKSGLLVNHTTISVLYSLDAPAY